MPLMDNSVFKICAAALITLLIVLLLRQYKPEYAVMAAISGVVVIALLLLKDLPNITDLAESFLEFGGVDSGWLKLLMKALGIAVLIQSSADLCRDNANTALAGAVELSGKVMIFMLAVPLLRAAAEIAAGLINS